MRLSSDFQENVRRFRAAAVDCPDYIINELKLKDETKLLLFYVDNMIQTDILYLQVLPILLETSADELRLAKLPFADVTVTATVEDALNGVGTGGINCNIFARRLEKNGKL